MLRDPDREKSKRVMQAMLGMKKIDIARLQPVGSDRLEGR
jgi:predicted 3-demethylubiquinone-9 3-methyltransferase (glyoxalase superfamily)